jgi:hypothetical protein
MARRPVLVVAVCAGGLLALKLHSHQIDWSKHNLGRNSFIVNTAACSPSSNDGIRSCFRGAIIGGAIGDAVGFPTMLTVL